MELSTDELEQIERYLTYRLPDDQRLTVDQRINQNPDFRDEVRAMRQSRFFLDQAVRLDQATQDKLTHMARSVICQLDAEPLVNQPERVLPAPTRRVGWGAFAMAALVLLIGGVFWVVSPVGLANADLNASTHREAMQSPTSTLRPAEREALENFLTANALYTNGEFEKAITFYEKAENGPISAYLKEAIWWNLSLAYLRTGNTTKAQQYWDQYDSLEQRHYPSTYLDRTQIRAKLFFGEIFS